MGSLAWKRCIEVVCTHALFDNTQEVGADGELTAAEIKRKKRLGTCCWGLHKARIEHRASMPCCTTISVYTPVHTLLSHACANTPTPPPHTHTERDPLHQGLIVKRSNLRSRNYDLQLDAKLGKTQIVSAHAGLSSQAGYYCNVCDCVLKDNQSWLDHINGKYHNRALGMNMVAERVTVDAV